MDKWTLSGFADEISPELSVQLDTLQAEGIRYLELRGIWGKNVLALSDEEVERAKKEMDARGVGVSAIGSPIGKIGIADDFDQHLVAFRRAIEVAKRLNCPYIRLFSFYLPEGEDPAKYRDQVMKRMQGLVDAAAGSGLILLHENEKGIYGQSAARCLDILKTIRSPYLRATFDPANFVQEGEKPYDHCFPLLRPHIQYMHIKDALFKDGSNVPAGEGDGQFAPILKSLKEGGWMGFLSLEPHLKVAGRSSGFTGPELFQKAARALKKLLDELGVAYA
jgi:sugar phosphate isomerase/epimerase